MPAKRSSTRRRWRVPSAWAGLTLLVVTAGCSTPPGEDSSYKHGSQSAATPAQPKKAEPAPAAAHQPELTAKPATTKEPVARTDPNPAAEPPAAGEKSSTVRTSPPGSVNIPPDTKLESEADRERLAQMIREAALAAQKARQEQGEPAQAPPVVAVPPPQAAKPKPATSTQPAAPAAKPDDAPHAEGEKKEAGCGSTGGVAIDLTPPPPDQPQPKAVIKDTKLSIDPVWRGTPAEFVIQVSNEGEAPLAVRLKKG